MKRQKNGPGNNEPDISAVHGVAVEARVQDALTHIDGESIAIPSGDPMVVRAMWMRVQGLSEDEISEMCDAAAYPGNVADELENLRAAQELR